jgi:membrane protease YdiL (CAAX protease family)
MPNPVDLAVAVLIAAAYPLWDYKWGWPRMLRTIRSGRPNARVPVYQEIIGQEWFLTAIIAGLWIRGGRPWSALGLLPPTGWSLVLSAALVAALLLLIFAQRRAVSRLTPEGRAKLRARNADVEPIVPRTRAEYSWFQPVALTAGICEEVIWRGFLVWAFQPWLGLWGSAVVSMISFAFAHAYQGRRGMIRAGIVGACFGVLAIFTHSILPGVVLHALVDLMGGMTSYAIFHDAEAEPAAA